MNRTVNLKNEYTSTNSAPSFTPYSILAYIATAMIYGSEFTAYSIGYFIHLVRAFVSGERMEAVIVFYKKYIRPWVITSLIFLFVGIVGGIEAGMISFAIGLPVCICVCAATAVYYNYFR